jgi:hypothetical protein
MVVYGITIGAKASAVGTDTATPLVKTMTTTDFQIALVSAASELLWKVLPVKAVQVDTPQASNIISFVG